MKFAAVAITLLGLTVPDDVLGFVAKLQDKPFGVASSLQVSDGFHVEGYDIVTQESLGGSLFRLSTKLMIRRVHSPVSVFV